jgi:glycosyltransferase involved in cell wall biosynthesis
LFSLRSVNVGERRLGYIDAFRAPSGHVRDNYAKFGFPAERIHVIPHPLDDKFLVEHTSDFSEPIKLLYVGYLKKHKGVDKLVPILDGLQKRGFDVQLTVAGAGGLRSKMEEQARDVGIEEHVDFLGFVSNDELPALYAHHDVFIHPGIWEEPLARVYIEALATGTPIVTRQYGSIDSIIGGGGVTTDGSGEDFTRTLANLINEERLPALSTAAKTQFGRYDRGRIVSQVEEVYNSLSA